MSIQDSLDVIKKFGEMIDDMNSKGKYMDSFDIIISNEFVNELCMTLDKCASTLKPLIVKYSLRQYNDEQK